MSDRPNLLVVMPDQQRMDSLGCYGNVFVETSAVDALAAGGVRLSKAFTTYPIYTPARATMWTGAYPHSHAIVRNVYEEPGAFAARGAIKTTIFNLLRDGGYAIRWKLILSEGGKNALYDLRDDPEEELDIFDVPRNDNQDQYRHYASHESVVVELATRLGAEAERIGDALGITLAEQVARDPSTGASFGAGDPV